MIASAEPGRVASQRELARRLGVSHTALQKAQRAGRIAPEADGAWDVAKTRARLAESSDPTRKTATLAQPAPPVAARPPVVPPIAAPDPLPRAAGSTFHDARTANEVLKAQERRLRLDERKGKLVDKARALLLVHRLAKEERDAILAWVCHPSGTSPAIASGVAVRTCLDVRGCSLQDAAMQPSSLRILDRAPQAMIGESPVWDDRSGMLWWVDIVAPALHRTDPADGTTETWPLAEPVGSLGLCHSGALLLSLRSGIHRFEPRDGSLALLAAPERDRPTNRLNDGKVSPEGRFLVGSMDDRPERAPTGALWRLDPGARDCVLLADGLLISNGLAWSPDGRTLWHSDSRASVIWTAPYDPATGALGERHVVARPDTATGRPDGAAVDTEGGYWSAGVSAGRLNRWLPDGTLDRVIELPVAAPTMPSFGGPGLRTLFVTSLRPPDRPCGPLDGRLLALDVGFAGTPVGRFAD